MNPASLPAKERAALSRLRQILNQSGLLRASWVKMMNTCGKSSCRCAANKRHRHISWYVSQSKNGKPRMKCIPRERLDEVRAWLSRHQEARELLEQVSDQYWERLIKRPKK